MAAECPLAERRIVEIKMGRSKFPGKPSKIGNRKRVNLSSCALPDENESSKAAENIYLGLSMFYEAFGDNEMVPIGPFPGFSPEEVEDALAEARLQQRESEMEYKRQGMIVNLQDSFQNEFSAISGCFSLNGNHDKNKTRLCFDGGGSKEVANSTEKVETNDSKPSTTNKITSNVHDINNDEVNDLILKNIGIRKNKVMCKSIRSDNSRRNIFKLTRKPGSFKSLQSRAAKKLLQKAKKSNIAELSKSNTSERKFVLPTYSMHSLRVIKPNKKFIQDTDGRKERFLNGRLRRCTPQIASKKSGARENKFSSSVLLNNELAADVTDDIGKKSTRTESDSEGKLLSRKEISDKWKRSTSMDSSKSNVHYTSTGKLILREPKLQLNRLNLSLTEGPFSASSHSSSLSPNSQLNPSPIQVSTINRTINCGICGSVKFYKIVELAKKFGIYCCEPCEKFISNIIKSVESEKSYKLQCLKGKGMCLVPQMMRKQHSGKSGMECQACWLKLCLRKLKLSVWLKFKLCEMLPVDMQLDNDLYSCGLSNDNTKAFGIRKTNVTDFKWLNHNDTHSDNENTSKRNKSVDVSHEKREIGKIDGTSTRELSLRQAGGSAIQETKKKLIRHKGRIKSLSDGSNRQRIDLKGPRVKNVCRSASIVLGQLIATFPLEPSPKKQINDTQTEIIKNCDRLEGSSGSCTESQGVLVVAKNKYGALSDKKQLNGEKKSSLGSKNISSTKVSLGQQQHSGNTRTKRKHNLKTENPISIDFWETYDPEEINESGFGLIGSENFSVRALCFLCGSSGQEKLIHCASCCEPYHQFCVDEEHVKVQDDVWKYDWICPRCTICFTCGKTSGQQLKCVKCDNSYHTECVDRVGGRLLHSPDRPWVCSVCLRCKSCNGVDVSVFVGNLPLCRSCFVLRQKGNYCPLCQRCYEDDDYDSKMMECGQCRCWVHAKCEGLSDEKYQVLSFLPESVEYICRMCCAMPPAPWWIAIEAELKSGYLGVLKALSKNRKACAMLKWSPRKQCTCRQVNFTPRQLDFDDVKPMKSTTELSQNKIENKKSEAESSEEKSKPESYKPSPVLERKTSIEVINHAQEGSLKLTLKIMKGTDGNENVESEGGYKTGKMKDVLEKFNIKECSVRVKKCPLNDDDSPMNSAGCQDDSQDKNIDFTGSGVEIPEKRSLSSPLNPSSDSGIGSTDDELKTNSLTDEESCRLDDPHSNRYMDSKISEPSGSFFEDRNECICFLEVDSYNSRSKPFSPSLLSIKKKVTTSEYSSLQQFHMDMQRMIATTQSTELMEMYHQTMKEIFPWFDPKFSRVHTSNSQKISDPTSAESTPVKNTPTKSITAEDCKVPKDKLAGQPLEYYYSDCTVEDGRTCLMCKGVGDGPPNGTGRLLYCGQNEWVHCNCALWSAEVFEEIDGSLQNVHSAINRGRSIRCPECNMKGASIGCCARNCADTYHFTCARKAGCAFMDDKTVFCPSHLNETKGKIAQNEKEFEIRRPVYVELDKRKMKSVDSSQVRFAVGGLSVENLGRFVMKLSDQPDGIIPDQFQCTKLFWSCYEPWRIVKYHFSVRIQEDEQMEGVDFGINLTVDHSKPPEILEMKLKQLKYFQEHHKLLEIDEPGAEKKTTEKRKINGLKSEEESKMKSDIQIPAKRAKKDKAGKKTVDLFDSREDESCLSDSQNTADLIPPELEEAIFKDLPNDILDGISMQDIFMDIKSDMYENVEKEVRDVDDALDVDDIIPAEQNKTKRMELSADSTSQNEVWSASDDSKQNVYEWTDEICTKSNRDLKRSRSDILPTRRNMTLKSNQRSCSLNWNCKMDIHTTKWKKNSKCNTTLLDPQERGNMLQELKLTDGLVMVSTESLTSVKDLKDRLAIQQEEGKENKCLTWHVKLQPRLLQVDGGVDSSSSGSEAGESPQRLIEENVINTRSIPPPQPSPFSSNAPYPEVSTQSPGDYSYLTPSFNLPQVDGLDDCSSDDSDFDYSKYAELRTTQCFSKSLKITQLDGSADSESESKLKRDEELPMSVDSTTINDEPVKCSQCRCTYRTKLSYERHLENCSNDFILFSSDGEGSEEEGQFHLMKTDGKTEQVAVTLNRESLSANSALKNEKSQKEEPQNAKIGSISLNDQNPVRKEKVKRPQMRKKPPPAAKKPQLITNNQNMQQILVQQNPMPQTVIVQDIPQPNIVPGTFIDTGGTIQYVTSLESQNAFSKPQLIATQGALMPGGFHIQTPESQLISGLPVLPQNIQTNLPGIIIHQPQVAGTLISPQPPSMVMSNDQMMLGAAPLLEFIHDPQTGGMFLASHNQPVFYNMETIVSNTVMQTNQFVSNVMTASSFSQTSTQVVQTSKLEQIMNVPPNFILVGQNSTSDKIITPGDLICLPASQPLIQNQTPIQTVVSPIIQACQAFNTEPKMVTNPANPTIRCIQSVQSKPSCTPLRAKTVASQVTRTPEKIPRVTATYSRNVQTKPKGNNFRSMPMMRPNVTKSPPRQYEKAVIVPKSQKTGSRAIVDYINNFKSENCDINPSLMKSDIKELKETRQLDLEPTALASEKKDLDPAVKPITAITLPATPSILSSEVAEEEKEKERGEKKESTPPPEEPPLIDLREPEPMEVDVKVETVLKEKEATLENCDTGNIPENEEDEGNSNDQSKGFIAPQEAVEKVKETSGEDPSTAATLPLQETSPTGNNMTNVPPKTGENEKLKEKTKLFSSNQNCVATKLVTIHPRLIQSPEFEAESENKKKFTLNGKPDDKGPKLIFDVISDDGFKSSSTSMAELWAKICDSVQEMRTVFKIPPLPISRKGHEILGMQNHGLQHCLEQLRGVENCVKYKCKYFVKERKTDDKLVPVKENLTGCARTETYCDRKEYDMFAWLASRHRRLPNLSETSEEILSTARRANSLPMAMRYRHLRETTKTYVGVYRSKIHGKGLFCLREIEAGEMVIEYAGEVIRSNITDKREKYYTDKGIGCYMFRIDDHFVVDATMKGNAARFINHSCEPNCYSRVVDILGKKHIVIFALRRIRVMEELTYDYKFPFEDEKISCHCLSKKCRKYLN